MVASHRRFPDSSNCPFSTVILKCVRLRESFSILTFDTAVICRVNSYGLCGFSTRFHTSRCVWNNGFSIFSRSAPIEEAHFPLGITTHGWISNKRFGGKNRGFECHSWMDTVDDRYHRGSRSCDGFGPYWSGGHVHFLPFSFFLFFFKQRAHV